MIQNYINHVVFVIDESGSMSDLREEVIKVFNDQIQYLSVRSQEVQQETRVSVYLFNNVTKCIIYDMDVMRLPKLDGNYWPFGGTALIDATLKSIDDLKKTPELYGDHAFLIYTLTDGSENASVRNASSRLQSEILSLPENWTLAVLVPNQTGVFEAKKFGFPAENIGIWDATSSKGMQKVGNLIRESTNQFFDGRTKGVRGTKGLFNLNVKLTNKEVSTNLEELPRTSYTTVNVFLTTNIRDAVERSIGVFNKGSAYYQLVKPETVQSYKELIVRNKTTGKVYSGSNARTLLGFPTGDVRVKPANLGKFDIFVQSTSVNRKVPAGTSLIVLN